MNLAIRLLFFALCLVFSATLFGQDFQIEEALTTKNGLPSNETYASFFDEKGDLWILTDKGLAKYNGLEFSYIRKSDGLPEHGVFKHFKDYKSRVWLTTTKGVCYLENDSIVVPQFNAQLVNHPYFNLINSLYVDSLDKVYIALERGICGYFVCNLATNQVRFHKLAENCLPFSYDYVKSSYDINLFVLKQRNKDILAAAANAFGSAFIPVSDSLTYPFVSLKRKTMNHAKVVHVYSAEQKLQYVALDHVLYQMNTTGDRAFAVRTFDKQIIHLAVKGQYLYICLREGGVIQRHLHSLDEKQFLSALSVAHLNFVSEYAFWAATLNNGLIKANVFLSEAFALPEYYEADAISSPVFFDGGELRLLRQKKVEIFRFKEGRMVRKKVYPLPYLREQVYGKVRWIGSDSLWVQNFLMDYVAGKQHAKLFASNVFGETKVSKFSKQLYCFGFGGLSVYSSDLKETYSSHQQNFNERILDLLEVGADSMLLGTNIGLYKLVKGRISAAPVANLTHQDRIDHLALFNGKVLVGTYGKGLVVFGDHSASTFSKANGLSGDFIQKIYVKGDTAWIGTNEGLNMLYTKIEEGSVKLTLSPILSKVSVDDILETSSGLYVKSMLGFYSLSDCNTISIDRPKLLLSGFSWGNKNYQANWGSEVLLTHEEQVLKVKYRLNKLLDRETQIYSYRILGLSDVWQETNLLEITLAQLPFGRYTLEIKGKDSNGMWTKTETLAFHLTPLIYETAWFQALVFLCIGLFIGGILWFGQKQYSKSLKRENLLLHTSMNSLKLQINPHFIFNALNSLQYFVVSDQKQKSTRFLTSFSQLVRDVLDSSLEKSSSLEQELRQIENYISLEQLRFEDPPLRFEVNASIPYSLSEVYIPNMLLQPLVENAVWHGFTGSKRAPLLILNIEKTPQGNLTLEVIDNGVGIDLEVMKERQSTGSLAVRNIEERLYLLSKLHKKPHSITFTQVWEEEEVSGTKVSLMLPLQIR